MSTLFRLDPFINPVGLLQISLPYGVKHPVNWYGFSLLVSSCSDCNWIELNMNTSKYSHMDGICKGFIKEVHSVIAGLLQEMGIQLDDDFLHTLFTEADHQPLTIEVYLMPSLQSSSLPRSLFAGSLLPRSPSQAASF